MLKSWCLLNYDKNKVNDQALWWNSKIRIDDKPFCWEHAFNKGLWKVSQLYNQGTLISIAEAKEKFDLNYLEFHALMAAIPQNVKEHCRINREENDYRSLFSECLDKAHLSQYAYNELIKKKEDTKTPKIKNKWEEKINATFGLCDFYRAVRNIYLYTNVPKLRSFQYRLLQRALVFNKDLYRWNMKETCLLRTAWRNTWTHFLPLWLCETFMAKIDWYRKRTPWDVYTV